jgi:putative DNA methylase
VWWDDLKARVRETARDRATAYESLGVRGVDLYIATFGPVLSVISERWPVLTSDVDPKTNKPKPLRPEMALEIAREEVIGLRKRGLLLGREVRFDPVTDWYLMAWDAFRAEEFPADEARKLAIALGLDLEETVVRAKRLVAKKGRNVILQQPGARRRRGMVDPDVEVFDCMLDGAHTAMLIFDEDGARACERWLRQRGLERDAPLRACFLAMANAIPTTKTKGAYIRPEMTLLDRMNDALGLEITFPVEPEPDLSAVQRSLFGRSDTDEDEEELEGEESESEEDEDGG